MDLKIVLGKNVKFYRKKSNLSQDALSEMLGISPKHMSKIETGEKFVSAEMLALLCKTLKVSASALFYNNDSDIGDDGFGKIERIIENKAANMTKELKDELRSILIEKD